MDSADLLQLVEHLEDNIDDLEESFEPLLSAGLQATTKKLPVLDKAKIYVLIVYSIESLLFSYVRLHGVNAKEHPVFTELVRVKQYFEKIKNAETGPAKPRENLSLNKQAAGRIIKFALSGNDKYDNERAEREAREKLLAKKKLKDLERAMQQEAQPANMSSEIAGHVDVKDDEEDDVDDDDEADEDMAEAIPPQTSQEPAPEDPQTNTPRTKRSKDGKPRKPRLSKGQKRARRAEKEKERVQRDAKSAVGDSG